MNEETINEFIEIVEKHFPESAMFTMILKNRVTKDKDFLNSIDQWGIRTWRKSD